MELRRYSKGEVGVCPYCDKEFAGGNRKMFCSPKCNSRYYKRNPSSSVFKGLPTATIGAISELVVSVELLKRGYDVYRAFSSSSYADIVAIKAGVINNIEVRTGSYYITKEGAKLTFPTHKMSEKVVIVVTHCDGKIHFVTKEL